MNGDKQNANTGLAELGRKNNYVVVQPSAPGGSWNASHYPKVYDFLNQNIEAWNIDKNRVHFTGFSQGSMMTWHFVCNYSDLIASAAPIAYHSSSLCFGSGKKNPPISILYHTGRSDTFASISSARSLEIKLFQVLT